MDMYQDPPDQRVAALESEFSDFSYIVAHDLAAPLRHVKGFLGLLSRDLDTVLTDRQQDMLRRIDRAADKGEALLAELGVYARVQQRPLDLAEYEAADLFKDARRALNQAVKDSGAEIVVGPLGRVVVDRMLMVEALRRILDNCLRFRRPDVPLRIEIDRIADSEDWVVRVADNGVGLPADQHEKVFRMFYRLTADQGEPPPGTGLTIGRRILRRHGGDIRFVERSDGACVELRLPAAAIA